MITSTLYLYTETPLHAGAGSGLSSIDLPIQRERTTQYPLIQSSGVKGKLRADKQVDAIANWIAQNALPNLGTDYWPNKVKSSLAILPNDVFRDFVLHATEVITRIRIDREKKTVDKGALWTEEHLPSDTLLYVPLYATKGRKKASQVTEQQVLDQVKILNNTYLQLGGDETVGRGLVRIRL